MKVGLKCVFLPDCSSVSEDHEFCAVEIFPVPDNKNNSIVAVGVYRPPKRPLPSFNTHIEDVALKLKNKTVLMGCDLNIDLIDDSINCNTFNTLYAFSYFPLINIATRIANTAKCLDHFWYNKLNVSFAGALITDTSDHYPIFTVINNINKGGLIKKNFS